MLNPIVATAGYYLMVEVGLIVNEKTFVDFFDIPLLHVVEEGAAIQVCFQLQTDMTSFFVSQHLGLSLTRSLLCSAGE